VFDQERIFEHSVVSVMLKYSCVVYYLHSIVKFDILKFVNIIFKMH